MGGKGTPKPETRQLSKAILDTVFSSNAPEPENVASYGKRASPNGTDYTLHEHGVILDYPRETNPTAGTLESGNSSPLWKSKTASEGNSVSTRREMGHRDREGRQHQRHQANRSPPG